MIKYLRRCPIPDVPSGKGEKRFSSLNPVWSIPIRLNIQEKFSNKTGKNGMIRESRFEMLNVLKEPAAQTMSKERYGEINLRVEITFA